VYRELSTVPDDRLLLVFKTRRLLLAYLDENNATGIEEVLHFIDSEIEGHGDGFLALLPRERLMLYYRVGAYGELPRYLSYLDTLTLSFQAGHLRDPDAFRDRLFTYFFYFREARQTGIHLSDISPEMKEMACIWLDYLVTGIDPSVKQEEINAACNRFLASRPGSPLARLVKLARVEWEPGGGMEYNMAVALHLPAGKLSAYISPSWGVFMSMEYAFKGNSRWRTGVSFSASNSRLSRDWPRAGSAWKQDARASLLHVSAAASYLLRDWKRFSIAPALSLGYFSIAPVAGDVEKDETLKHAGASAFMYGPVAKFDVKLGSRASASGWLAHALRLRYAFLHPLFGSRHQLTGVLHEFSISYCWFTATSRRKQ
jgi:hypothetical protein